MTITNNNKALIDLPVWEVLQPAPAASAAGTSLASDGVRYLYYLISATSFWRYDTWANAWQKLANPPGGTVGAGTCMQWDHVNTRMWALITSGSGAPTWQYYDPTTNAWTARSVTNLPGTFGTEGALTFPNVPDGGPSSDYMYLVGNNASIFYRYQISTNAWIASPTTIASCPSTSAAGCQLIWLPSHLTENDHIVRVRGAASVTVDYYDIGANTWTAIAYKPDTETFTTGSYSCRLLTQTGHIALQKDATMRIFGLDVSTATPVMDMLATQYLLADGAAVVGNRMDTMKSADDIEFLYMILHTSDQLVRTPIYF